MNGQNANMVLILDACHPKDAATELVQPAKATLDTGPGVRFDPVGRANYPLHPRHLQPVELDTVNQRMAGQTDRFHGKPYSTLTVGLAIFPP